MKKTSLSILFALLCISSKVLAQCGPFSISSPDNCISCGIIHIEDTTVICAGGMAVVHPVFIPASGFTAVSYQWTPVTTVLPTGGGSGTPSFPTTIIPPPPVSPPACGFVDNPYELDVTAFSPNYVLNGDFNLGVADYCTSYGYVVPGNCSLPAAIDFPYYTVCSNACDMKVPGIGPLDPLSPFSGCTNMMLFVSDPNVTQYWSQTVWTCGKSYNNPYSVDTVEYHFSFEQATLDHSYGYPGPFVPVATDITITDAFGNVTTYLSNTGTATAWNMWGLVSLSWSNSYHAPYATISISGHNPYGVIFALDSMNFNRVCVVKDTIDVRVDYNSISGPATVCLNSIVPFTDCNLGGIWASGNPSVAHVDGSGDVTGEDTGSAVINYTDIYGCAAHTTVTVLPLPEITIPPVSVCSLATSPGIILTSIPTTGTWFEYAPVYGPGPVYHVNTSSSPGIYNDAISFTDTVSGCIAWFPVTIKALPDPLPNLYICEGDTLMVSDLPAGGTWSPLPHVTPGGTLSAGLTPGVFTIMYTAPDGCSTDEWVSVYDCTNGVIVGGNGVCAGSCIGLIGLPTGGTWTSSDSSNAPIGLTTGVLCASVTCPGETVTVTYTVGSIVTTTTITVFPEATACDSTIYDTTGYYIDFYSNCTGGCEIEYQVYKYDSTPIVDTCTGSYYGTCAPGVIPFPTLAACWPQAYRVCITGVICNGCWYPASCCAQVNPADRFADPYGIQSTSGELKVVPNPNNGSFDITGSVPGDTRSQTAIVEVTDVLGRAVYSEVVDVQNGSIHKNVMLAESVANGIYFARVKNGESSQVIRFSMNR